LWGACGDSKATLLGLLLHHAWQLYIGLGMDYDYVIDVVAGSKKPLELDMVQYRPIIL